eukprot:7383420-Prymnesium_polylepis.1
MHLAFHRTGRVLKAFVCCRNLCKGGMDPAWCARKDYIDPPPSPIGRSNGKTSSADESEKRLVPLELHCRLSECTSASHAMHALSNPANTSHPHAIPCRRCYTCQQDGKCIRCTEADHMAFYDRKCMDYNWPEGSPKMQTGDIRRAMTSDGIGASRRISDQ